LNGCGRNSPWVNRQRPGVDSGFNKAYWSIVDAQVTTLITALVLFLFGTGPIKGFAITLSLGIIFNLFAVLFVREAFARNDMAEIDLQKVENEFRLIVKIKKADAVVANLEETVGAILSAELPGKNFVIESQSEIGASVSATLRNKAIQAIIISLAGIIIYLAFRFDIRFGLAGAIATFHDVLVVLGICWLLNVEITLLIVTALLTLAGYSINDSVVVFDRIRENIKKMEEHSLVAAINLSINQVLARTIVLSLTTGAVLLTLFLFGGTVIRDFAFTLLVGILVGTYSSIFIASPLLTHWKEKKA
jgi:SecD/SecF fusion protein